MTKLTENDSNLLRPTRIIAIAVAVTAAVVTTATALVLATEIFLILFLAMLFGVFLNRCSEFISEKTTVAYGWCLGVVTLLLVTSIVGGIGLFGARVDQQLSGAGKRIDEAREKLQSFSEQYPTLKSVLNSTPVLRDLVTQDSESSSKTKKETSNQKSSSAGGNSASGSSANGRNQQEGQRSPPGSGAIANAAQTAASAVSKIFQTTFGLLVNSVLIFFVGVFLAASPTTYRDGFVALFPKRRRERVTEVLNMMSDSLWNWLVGRFGSMLATGFGAGMLLWLLGVPMAISAGFATGLLTFIPNIGGLLSLTLAMLLALPDGLTTVQLVFFGYMALQLVESYLVTPLIQQKQVSLPPALLISFQAVMGVLFGFLGAAVASPLLAATKTLVQEAYIHDVLDASGNDRSVPTNES